MKINFRGNDFYLCEQGCLWHLCYGEDDDSEIVYLRTAGTATCTRCGAKITNRAGLIWRMWWSACSFREDAYEQNIDVFDPCVLGEGKMVGGLTWIELYQKLEREGR
jgi:hypothetical protein